MRTDKKRVQRTVSDLFIRYGAGTQYLRRFISGHAWNLIAWILIGLGVVGWVLFLRWQP